MEKWQLAGIISNDSRTEIILPAKGHHKSSLKVKRSMGDGRIFRFLQTSLRKMTEVIALF